MFRKLVYKRKLQSISNTYASIGQDLKLLDLWTGNPRDNLLRKIMRFIEFTGPPRVSRGHQTINFTFGSVILNLMAAIKRKSLLNF